MRRLTGFGLDSAQCHSWIESGPRYEGDVIVSHAAAFAAGRGLVQAHERHDSMRDAAIRDIENYEATPIRH